MRGSWWVLVLAGCGVSEEDFPDAYADAVCALQYRCDRTDYDATYASDEACAADARAYVEDWSGVQSALGNSYDEEHGTDCVAAIRHATCDTYEAGDWQDTCAEVWR